MKLVAPFSKGEELVPLIEAGVDEFYCGIVPPDWVERFHSSGVNRRPFGNLASYDELARAVEIAGRHGRSVSLVLNAQHYTGEMVEALVELAARFAGMGGRAAIVGDIGLLAVLAESDTGLRLHASSLLSCRNAEAAGLHGALGADRVVFPRDVTLAEMARIKAAHPELEFEAFVLNDGCVFEEGSCHTIHLPGRLGGPICLDKYQIAYARADGGELHADMLARLAANDEAYQEWLWYRFSCGFSLTDEGLPFGPCGLCAIPFLAQAGIASIKVAGREGNLARKIKSVELVRGVLDRQAQGEPAAHVAAAAQDARRRPDLCAGGYMCYYREVLRPGFYQRGPFARLEGAG